MNKTHLIIGLCFSSLFFSQAVQAEIYKKVDADGHVTYSNVPSKGATKLNLEPPASNKSGSGADRASRAKMPTPANFPRIDRETQNQRDDKRKQILQEELEAEKKALDEARQAHAEAKSRPEIYSDAKGKTSYVPGFEDKLRKLQAELETHEKNIQLLQKELNLFK